MAFLGDPNFPIFAIGATRGDRILLYQSLYKQYSTLAFSKIEDRRIGIGGLEQRLIRAFKVQGGFGIFQGYADHEEDHGYFGRSLLWKRAEEVEKMTKIDYTSMKPPVLVPTWSWMAYREEIDYIDEKNLPFNGVKWKTEEIQSPWSPSPTNPWHTGDRRGNIDLTGVARDFTSNTSNESNITYDDPAVSADPALKCVVIGTKKYRASAAELRHYVLIIKPKPGTGNDGAFERVGVGFMPGASISLNGSGLKVRIR